MKALPYRLGALLTLTAIFSLTARAEDPVPATDKPPAESSPPLPPSDFKSELDLQPMIPLDSNEVPAEPPAPPAAVEAEVPEGPTRTIVAPSNMPVINPPAGKTEEGIVHEPPSSPVSNMPIVNVEVPTTETVPAPETAPATQSEVPAETK